MIYTLTLNPAIDRELTVEEIEYNKVLSAMEARVDLGGKGSAPTDSMRAGADTPPCRP